MGNWTHDDAGRYSKRYRQEEESNDDLLPKYGGGDRDIKAVKPDYYNGKLLHSFKEYVRRCELTFHLGPEQYFKDSTKVLYTAQFLAGETARTFEQLEEVNSLDNMS